MSKTPKAMKQRWLRRLGWTILVVVVLWILGDAGYAWYVSRSISAWEDSIERQADGVQIGCERFVEGEGATAVLFVHGINDSARVWKKVVPVVAADDCTCVAMRLPGFGEPIPRYASVTKEEWMDEVESEFLRLKETHEQVILVAHSLGCAVTLRLLQTDRISPDGVVFVAPAIAVSNDRSPVLSTTTWHWLAGRLLFFTKTTMNPFGVDAHDPEERQNPLNIPFTPRSVIDEVFALMQSNRDHAEPFSYPLLLIIATDDHVIDNDAARRFYEQSKGQPKRLLEVNDSAHMIPVDLDWKIVADAIVEFRESLSLRDR